MGLLRTLLIILLVYYAFRFLARLFAPVLMKRMVSKMQEKAQQQYNQQRQNSTTARDGETVIDRKPGATKQGNDTVGEYVDFEEID
ncbi:DUF4834 family protein [Pseudotenacibaculum sp. MALMAid0570]|uniref:DUF4834 family protein n=1 Tax=Pseudotenacibaculum sp. MALMAid0570 TaxID=3143938 RepID=UPI0032DF82A3